eukprot:2065484-Pyramimonas_sp.AAC.1
MMHIHRERDRLAVVNGEDQVALNLVVASGGQWPRQRLRDAGYVVPSLGPRCHEKPEPLFHRVWERSANTQHKDFDDSQHLYPEAQAQHEAYPGFWLRGVPG